MYMQRLWKLPFFVLAFAASLDYATTGPIDEVSSRSELRDLNKIPLKTRIDEKTESSSFTHYDEDSLRLVVDLSADQKFKYDVEILEPRDNKKETVELEERFRGPSIKLDTDNFVAENIEVNGDKAGVNAAVHTGKANTDESIEVAHNDDDDDDDDDEEEELDGDGHRNHILLTLVLVLVALFSITIYIALVLWRSYLERRYAESELLVNDDDDFYLSSSEITYRRC